MSKLDQAKLDKAITLAGQHLELVAVLRNSETRKKEIEEELLALGILTHDPKAEPDKTSILATFNGVLKLCPGRKTSVKDDIAKAQIKDLEEKLALERHIIPGVGNPFFQATLGNGLLEQA